MQGFYFPTNAEKSLTIQHDVFRDACVTQQLQRRPRGTEKPGKKHLHLLYCNLQKLSTQLQYVFEKMEPTRIHYNDFHELSVLR
jgi:hypothetical protein